MGLTTLLSCDDDDDDDAVIDAVDDVTAEGVDDDCADADGIDTPFDPACLFLPEFSGTCPVSFPVTDADPVSWRCRPCRCFRKDCSFRYVRNDVSFGLNTQAVTNEHG